MQLLANTYRILFLGILFTFCLFGVFPVEFTVVTLLFLAICYCGILLIKLATSQDSKMKKVDKT